MAIPQYKISPDLAPKFPLIIALPAIFLALLTVLAFYIPGLGALIYPFWSGIGLDESVIAAAGGIASQNLTGIVRIPGTMAIGENIVHLLCAYLPVGLFITPMNPWPFIAFVIAITAWLASGFRSASLVYAGYLIYNSYLRRRLHDLIPAAALGVILASILIVGQGTLFDLPPGMQRALSFLPGHWNEEAVPTPKAQHNGASIFGGQF